VIEAEDVEAVDTWVIHWHAAPDMYAHRLAISANALRTSDGEIPNCRAILDGVMPALKAARTAFSFPWVNGAAATTSTRRVPGIFSGKLLAPSLLLRNDRG